MTTKLTTYRHKKSHVMKLFY